MFPKGPRFLPQKVSDVPGPNAYNLNQESQLDAYKRGAFLEKTDRFSKDKHSDVPGPGTYSTDMKKPSADGSKSPSDTTERYVILQRKVADLEKMHADSKKSHQAEIERLKLELTRSQKNSSDVSERLDKARNQNEALDIRIQEYKKTMLTDQAEIKDLRVKLRMSDHERTQLSAKQGELAEVKKALQTLESRRREEIRERDRKIADLEKSVALEKKMRLATEARLQDIKESTDAELQEARTLSQSLQIAVNDARYEAQQARSSLVELENEAAVSKEDLVLQLEQYRSLLGRVVEEYGYLASAAVPASAHSRIKNEHSVLQVRVLRLERKLANSEGQVVELANLVRQTKEENSFLSERLRDVTEEVAFYTSSLSDRAVIQDNDIQSAMDSKLRADLSIIELDIRNSERQLQHCLAVGHEFFDQFYHLKFDDLLLLYTITDKALQDEQALVQQQTADLSDASAARVSLISQLDNMQIERDAVQGKLHCAAAYMEEMRTKTEALEQQLEQTKSAMLAQVSQSDAVLKSEREVVQRLTSTMQINKMAEEGLRAEVERLTAELTDAERYQEAYYNLLDEVGVLVARNALAEDEAQRLSKFNAEILGHANPAQRIMYVDRIRRELAEAKHKHLMATRDHDAALADNADLRHELAMYKSVTIPVGDKPRTNITRIARLPLANQNLNVSTAHLDVVVQGSEVIAGNMTLDEIM